MAVYEKPNVPQGGTINLRAQPAASADTITNVKVYAGGTPGVPGTGALVTTLAGSGAVIAGGEWVLAWGVPSGQAQGTYYDDWTYVLGGVTQAVVRMTGFAITAPATLGQGAVPSYPYPYGYCQEADVTALVPGWDPAAVNAAPSRIANQNWMKQGAAGIDAALRTRGYYIPLQVDPAYPGGIIGQQAFTILQQINAYFAASHVEAARHGGQGLTDDHQARHWMTLYDDFLTRIETGADNLGSFGVGGDFPPMLDEAKGFESGSFGANMGTGDDEGPRFVLGSVPGSGTGWP